MSYPKVPPKATQTAATKLSEQQKARLLKLQEREELKGLLVNKFKKKYGNEAGFIDKEVENFMKQETLTESNLQKLDDKIKKKVEADQKSVSHKSEVQSKHVTPSVRSSKNSVKGSDQMSVASSMRSSARTSEFVPEDNEDEWAAILEYDTMMFHEEEKSRLRREIENKMKLKRELDRQLNDKNRKKLSEEEEERLYDEAQKRNIEMMELKEKERDLMYREKVMQEKLLRDKQLGEEKRRKRLDERQQRELDEKLVMRLQEELKADQVAFEEKRRDERIYMLKMMEENEENKKRQMEIKEFERQNDVKSMEDYAKMLDKQEEDRLNEIKAREERQQLLMARMADTVLKEQKQKNHEEDLMLLKQIEEKELLDKAEDERRMLQLKKQKQDIRKILDKQVDEKNKRKVMEKKNQDEQADMWKKDADEFYKLEDERKMREKQLNMMHVEILRSQMDEKNMKKKKVIMNKDEIKMNKNLLKKIYQDKSEGQSRVEDN
ncbi:hypothetical protein SteCoe_13340 [Stentor coeruleus]|uniref:Trichohyalin-plectin-homology domain-containing protein n=1 Tax=Stentor coeruleus TaxID=5963 RepID=A0A1R2C8M7_9CILI|nr:hypothetical protein SteCoe_13340 [Stentor coeruleus]